MKTSKYLYILLLITLSITTAYCDAVMRPATKTYPSRLLKHVSSEIEIIIRGDIVETAVYSEFENESNEIISGTYFFPLPENANATGLWYQWNNEYYEAVLKQKPQSTDNQKGEGGFVAELNNFLGKNKVSIQIDSIAPRSTQKVIIRYIERIDYTNGVFSYKFPLSSSDYIYNPIEYLKLKVHIKKHNGIKNIEFLSPSDDWKEINKDSTFYSVERISLKDWLQEDLELKYSLYQQDFSIVTGSGIGKDKNGYMSISLFPGDNDICLETDYNKHVAFCLDRSRSMEGFKLEQSCEAIKNAINILKKDDKISLITFDYNATIFLNRINATEKNKNTALAILDTLNKVTFSNETNLANGLINTLSCFNDSDDIKLIYGFTDGFTSCKPEDITNSINAEIYLIGLGDKVSRERLELISYDHQGKACFIKANESVIDKSQQFFSKITSPVLSIADLPHLSLSLKDINMVKMPFTYYKGQNIHITARYNTTNNINHALSGTSNNGLKSYSFNTNLIDDTLTLSNYWIEHIWAAETIRMLEQQMIVYNKQNELIDSVSEISILHGVKSNYTSYWSDYITIADDDIGTTTEITKSHKSFPSNYSIQYKAGILNFKFQIPVSLSNSLVTATLCDIRGRKIKTLLNDYKKAGSYHFSWNANQLNGISNGYYVLLLKIGNISKAIPIHLIM